MIPKAFEYFAPKTLSEAVSLLRKYGEEAKVLAGGQSLIPLMKLRLASPGYIVDINRIAGLEYIRESNGFLRIGALTRIADMEASSLIQSKYSILADAASHIADPLVRNMGTAGGNVCHGDPANDLPATMLALGANYMVFGGRRKRIISAEDFYLDTFVVALKPDEILTEIRVPAPSRRSGGAYLKLERRAGDFPIVGVAAQLTIDGREVCKSVSLGLTAAGPTALKAQKAEKYLIGKKVEDDKIRKVAELAAEQSRPISDLRGSAEYKRDMVGVLTRRALYRALERVK